MSDGKKLKKEETKSLTESKVKLILQHRMNNFLSVIRVVCFLDGDKIP